MKKITYKKRGKKKTIYAKQVSIFSPGLMFNFHKTPILFSLNKEKKFSIFSIFCEPFTAIWLDKKFNATKIVEVKKWKLKIQGKGKYLLEIPKEKH